VVGLIRSAVVRIRHAFGLRPHRWETFKLSQVPLFVDKARDIVRLYLSPPAHALVLCVDEKPAIQAIERTAPGAADAPGAGGAARPRLRPVWLYRPVRRGRAGPADTAAPRSARVLRPSTS
jgi:hypothetical protein